MILEFRLGNFRSFKDETAFSLVASKDKNLLTNTLDTDIPSIPRVLRSAVVYGQNASGKSNLLRGLWFMQAMILQSASLKPNETFNFQPFRLDPETKDKPTLFEVTVSINGIRYQYGFEMTATRIHAEWLLVYNSSKASAWLDRKWNEDIKEDEYKFGSGLKGPKQVWKEATRSNALFLSTAVQLNSEALAPLHKWFSESLHVVLTTQLINEMPSTDKVRDSIWARRIVDFISSADIAISSIHAHEQEGFHATVEIDTASGNIPKNRIEKGRILRPRFIHSVGQTSAEMNIEDESDGTQKLFALAGPLLEIIQKGQVLVIDELDRSLHEMLVRHLVRLFQDPENNPKGAQLIFTTHDSSLLEGPLLRRDQVWFVERDNKLSSYLVPLTEYAARKDEALDRGYRAGRYGGVPMLQPALKVKAEFSAE